MRERGRVAEWSGGQFSPFGGHHKNFDNLQMFAEIFVVQHTLDRNLKRKAKLPKKFARGFTGPQAGSAMKFRMMALVHILKAPP